MEIIARTRMIRISPRKVRLVGDVIKRKNINDAMGMLMYMPQKAAFILKKLLDSAVANAKQKKYVDVDNLFVKNVLVDGGPVLKRFLPRAMGRATKIRKRTSHITMILDEL
ncbi:MAG TPA: 50S ribosomal protein L22 [Syntrophorhabdaceae bacterium]|jgi:large subunit ribosomal protein L22|nr:50S ribosomal protein L22 [Syntrophorhabdaceae bacterium]MDI9560676.1 50S ribosomal protein L22 [Pseudomonadota bacterium]OQC47037.1 MAG: 50S ribosomal protein L22 [Deltaproteobacteria bacterium ADurb.Bin026]MBV6506029.1 50S ribosomal protein L22 [Syntrophorhabdaceae bacterium]HNQ63865.1 50S ribosomal protein L22 [Syntrophorhabdaceae bacterium]